MKRVRGRAEYVPGDYFERFPSRLPEVIADWMDRRIWSPHAEPMGLMAPHEQSQIDWMVRKAMLADGTEPFQLPLPAGMIEEEFIRLRNEEPAWPGGIARESGALWQAMIAGLLRHGCALAYAEIRARTGVPDTTIVLRARRHRRALASPEYARRTAFVIERVQRRLAEAAYPHRFLAADALTASSR